jgi:hypothetical protein
MRDGYKQENSSLLVTTHYVVVVHNILFSMDRDIFFLYFILFYFLLFIYSVS